jgi:threonine/homoserine/homoserine lactone efflux protein
MLNTLLTIWLLYLTVMVSPGPNILLVTQLAASQDRRSARYAGAGVATVAGIWAACAVLGVNAIFVAFPQLRLGLQVAGGLYLLYVASTLWRSKGLAATEGVRVHSRAAAFRMGFLTNITNPKAALFFGSVFAASLPARPSAVLQASVVTMVFLTALAWYFLLAQLFSARTVREGYASISAAVNRVASTAFGLLGISLLVASWQEARTRT